MRWALSISAPKLPKRGTGLFVPERTMADPISVIMLEPHSRSAQSLTDVLGRVGQAEMLPVPNIEEACQAALQLQPCLLVLSIANAVEGQTQLQALKKMEKTIRGGGIKVIALSAADDPVVTRGFSELGVTDYLPEPVQARALLYKVNFAFKALQVARRRSKNAEDEKIVFKADQAKEEPLRKPDVLKGEIGARYKPALQLGEDIFVFKNAFPRKMGKKLVLQVEGPDPLTGSWRRDSSKKGSKGAATWRWEPHGEEASAEGDGWVFVGEEPTYAEGTGKWQLRSESPILAFRRGGNLEAVKVATDDAGQVEIAEDSDAAQENLRENHARAQLLREEAASRAFLRAKTESAVPRDRPPLEIEEDEVEPPKFREVAPEKPEAMVGASGGSASTNRDLAASGLAPTGETESARKDQSKVCLTEPSDSPPETQSTTNQGMGGPIRISGSPEAAEEIPESATRATEASAAVAESSSRPQSRTATEFDAEISRAAANERAPRELGLGGKPGERVQPVEREQSAREAIRKPKALAAGEFDEPNEKKTLRPQAAEKDPPPRRTARASNLETEAGMRERLREIAGAELRETDAPLPDELPPETERDLRRELGVEDRAEISPRELAARAREEKLKALREERRLLEEALGDPGAVFDDPLADPAPGRDSPANDASREGKQRNFRAIESIGENSSDEVSGRSGNSGKDAPEDSGKYHYLPVTDVRPYEGLWERDGRKWLYVPTAIYESGFDRIESLLPTWLYEGHREPVLEEAKARWKFAFTKPVRVETADQIPPAFRELLEGIQNQGFLARGIDPKVAREQLAGYESPAARAPGPAAEADGTPAEKDSSRMPGPELVALLPQSPERRSAADASGSDTAEKSAVEDPEGSVSRNRKSSAPVEDPADASRTATGILPVGRLTQREVFALAALGDFRRHRERNTPARKQAVEMLRKVFPGWTIEASRGERRIPVPTARPALWLVPPRDRQALTEAEARFWELVAAAFSRIADREPGLTEAA